jgi:hypothetical protein
MLQKPYSTSHTKHISQFNTTYISHFHNKSGPLEGKADPRAYAPHWIASTYVTTYTSIQASYLYTWELVSDLVIRVSYRYIIVIHSFEVA